MALIISQKVEQKQIIDEMSQLISPISTIHSKYNSLLYYVLKYNVIDNFDYCKKFVIFFSNNSKIGQGLKRVAMEFDNVAITLSINYWVTVDQLINEQLNYKIEYYIHTVNNLPHTIFFRIRNSEESYEAKLKYFIDSILLLNRLSEGFTGTGLPTINVEIDIPNLLIEEIKENDHSQMQDVQVDKRVPMKLPKKIPEKLPGRVIKIISYVAVILFFYYNTSPLI
ncbi:MAG: hypothetical protein Barrevirus6_14 [Barrevirus sp.]|uniref:Uncharacterized protein n=1 Tax=Barrevirus sp. TaxID=2487763 RepID=A0A3G4ZQ02_9VIRU|nr:MAG: hypothetical protein Barrevirus6_14 [Barrevirus sp.]